MGIHWYSNRKEMLEEQERVFAMATDDTPRDQWGVLVNGGKEEDWMEEKVKSANKGMEEKLDRLTNLVQVMATTMGD